ncbi:MAG: retroviral-like aspartic protease family protein [Proteobacteria bacterium]|nr:retroviral-like aspartic protease family protein [Pseudomonadota bacterium]
MTITDACPSETRLSVVAAILNRLIAAYNRPRFGAAPDVRNPNAAGLLGPLLNVVGQIASLNASRLPYQKECVCNWRHISTKCSDRRTARGARIDTSTQQEAAMLSPGRHIRRVLLCWIALALSPTNAATAGCQLVKLLEMPVTMEGLRPTVRGSINGGDALFLADSGAFFSSLTSAAAAQYKLHVESLPPGFYVEGVGGAASAGLARVHALGFAGLSVANIPFLVLDNDIGSGVAGLLGQNVFRISDVEYDLANGAIRLMRPHDCGKSVLAYWASAGQAYSVMNIESPSERDPRTNGTAFVNGQRVRVTFDTGAATSVLTLAAAKRAGVTPGSAGTMPAGHESGIGRHSGQTWVAPFASFKIGDEEIRHTRLRIGELNLPGADMLLGADFFLSHRIFVANSQGKLYFTYNGGPVFNLSANPGATRTASPASPAAVRPSPAKQRGGLMPAAPPRAPLVSIVHGSTA